MSSWHEVSATGSHVGRIKVPAYFHKLWQGSLVLENFSLNFGQEIFETT